MRDYYVVVTRSNSDAPWQAYKKDNGDINQYDRIEKANGVMKAVFYTKTLSGDAKIILKSEWLESQRQG